MARIHALSPVVLPLRAYTFRGPIAGSTSVGFTQTATLTGIQPTIAANETIAVTQSGTVEGTGRLFISASLGFTASGTMQAEGVLQAATSLAFTASARPVRDTQQGQTGFDIAASATLEATGRARALASVDLSTSGAVQATGFIQATPTVTVTPAPTITAQGALQGSTAVGFIAVGQTQTGNLIGSEPIGFSATGNLLANGQLQSSQDVSFLVSATLDSPGNYEVSPMLLPIRRYRIAARPPNAQGQVSFDFVASATLTGLGGVGGDQIQGSTSIADVFTAFVWLRGQGQLQGAASIDFAASAAVLLGGIAANESIDTTATATATATGQLQGSVTIGFSESGSIDLIAAAQGSETISLTATGTVEATGSLQGATTIRFLNPGSLISPIFGSTSFGFTAAARPSGADFTRKAGQFYIKVLPDNLTITVAAESLTVVVEPESPTVKVTAQNDTITVPAPEVLEVE